MIDTRRFSTGHTNGSDHLKRAMECDDLLVPETIHVTPKKKYMHQFWHPNHSEHTLVSTKCPAPNKLTDRVSKGRVRHPKNKQEDFRRVCWVCTLPAEYYNSGAISCESCKMFFCRNNNKLLGLHCVAMRHMPASMDDDDDTGASDRRVSPEWLQEIWCDLRQTGKKRLCPLCRLKKCFLVGMRPRHHDDKGVNLENLPTPVTEQEETRNVSMTQASDVSLESVTIPRNSVQPSVNWRISSTEEDEDSCEAKTHSDCHEVSVARIPVVKLNSVSCNIPALSTSFSSGQQQLPKNTNYSPNRNESKGTTKAPIINSSTSLLSLVNGFQLGTSIYSLAESDPFLRIIFATPKDALLYDAVFPETNFCAEMTSCLQALFRSRFVVPRELQKSSWCSMRCLAEALALRTVEFFRHMPPLSSWSVEESQSVLKTRLTVMVCHLSILFADAPYSEFSWTAALGQYRAIVLLLQPLLATEYGVFPSVFHVHSLFTTRMNEVLQNDLQLRLIFLALKLVEVLPAHKQYLATEELYNACLQAFRRLAHQLWRSFIASASSLRPTDAAWNATAKAQSQRWLNFCLLFAWSRHHFDVGCMREVGALHTRPEMGDVLHSLAAVVDRAVL